MSIYNIWANTVPAILNNAGGPYTLGFRFTSTCIGNVLGIRFYKSSSDTGVHVGSLWNLAGTRLATVTFTGETASGWQYMAFASPYTIAANTTYVASVYHPASMFSYTLPFPAAIGSGFTPLSLAGTNGYYDVGNVYPSSTGGSYWYTTDVNFDDLGNFVVPTAHSTISGYPRVVGWLKGVNLGGPTSYYGDSPNGRHMQVGIRRDTTAGYLGSDALALDIPGFWRFRWQVDSGRANTVSILAKQVSNVTGKRPSMIVRKNTAIGVNADVSGSAPSGTGLVTIGPLSVTPSSKGVLDVELWNNDTDTFNSPAFFDHLIFT